MSAVLDGSSTCLICLCKCQHVSYAASINACVIACLIVSLSAMMLKCLLVLQVSYLLAYLQPFISNSM